MPKDQYPNIQQASTHKEIPQAAGRAFRAAHLKALNSNAGVIVVSNGKLEHRHIEKDILITENVGEAPKPLVVGVGARKKRREK